ncbi:MAG: kelch repeat-containing protein [Myxococcales bacterium]|nr:kelch repeat-containing protein [Myxococcales bacterium]
MWMHLALACTGPVNTLSPTDTSTATSLTDGPPQESGWFRAKPLLEPLQEHSVVALDGEVVVLGGYDDRTQMVDRVEAYDPSTNEWRSLAPLPEPSHHVNAAVVDGKIYVLGVLQGGFLESAVAWVYDPVTDAWSDVRPPPSDRAVGAAAVAVVGTDVHLMGGLRSLRAVSLHSVYDTVGDRWDPLPDVPRDRDHGAGGGSGSAAWAAAGRDGGLTALIGAFDVFDPVLGAWSDGPAIPTPRGGVAAAVDGDGAWHVVGGEGNSADPSGVFGDHEVYDPGTGGWARLDPMRTPRHGMGAVFVDGVLWVPGGAEVQAFGATALHEGYRP